MSRLSICIVLIAVLFAINTLSVVYAAPAQKEPKKVTNKTVASSSDAPSSTEGTMDAPASSVNPTDGPPSGTTTSDNLAPAESALLPVSSMVAAGLAVLLL
ncbi:hypothetical protein WR25_19537 [Diploscapter pachys]|uniref:Uncharacterized protein n=1 Tax=Diploscapter pachys TaxID=2018661 RepID=A0A2A2JEK1_9BILA|nr:hypothetical protein WR25_19537 [Diploscapter pachys]